MNFYAKRKRTNSAFSEQSGRALLLCAGKEGASMKPWAEQFYNSEAWRSCRDAFLQSKGYLCERCSTPHNPVAAKIAHHKTVGLSNILDSELCRRKPAEGSHR